MSCVVSRAAIPDATLRRAHSAYLGDSAVPAPDATRHGRAIQPRVVEAAHHRPGRENEDVGRQGEDDQRVGVDTHPEAFPHAKLHFHQTAGKTIGVSTACQRESPSCARHGQTASREPQAIWNRAGSRPVSGSGMTLQKHHRYEYKLFIYNLLHQTRSRRRPVRKVLLHAPMRRTLY